MKKALNQLFFFLPSLLPYHCFYHVLLAVLGFCFFSWISEIIKGESRAEFPADSGRLPWGSTPYIPGFPLLLFHLHYRHFLTLLASQGFSLWPHARPNCPAMQKLRKNLHSMETVGSRIHFSYSFSFCLSSEWAKLHDSIDPFTVLTSSSYS